jgi:hypothetical protein
MSNPTDPIPTPTLAIESKRRIVSQPIYTYPGFFEDIVPRLLDNKYGPDIAVLINTCLIARIPPQKQSGGIDWDHDITYRAMYDAKVKASDDPFFSDVLRKDSYLHRHMAAALALNHKAKYSFFLEHRVPPLSCTAIIVLSHMSVPVLDESHIVLSLASADA